MISVVLIGAQASDKMTIGQALEKQTDMTLFHNHETIDFVTKFFPMSAEAKVLIDKIRFAFFETFAKLRNPMIFTICINFADEDDLAYLKRIQDIFQHYQESVLFVELETDLSERLRRNRTENRLKHKPIKRDLAWSEADILATAQDCQLNSKSQPVELSRYLKINNTKLSADEVAEKIAKELLKWKFIN